MWSCLGDVAVTSRCCFNGVSVMFFVMSRFCLGGVSVMCRSGLGDVSVMCWSCLGDVSGFVSVMCSLFE